MTRTILWLSILTIPIVLIIAGSLLGDTPVVAQQPDLKSLHNHLHHPDHGFNVLTLVKTIPKSTIDVEPFGDDVTWTITALTDAVVYRIWRDNFPTAGLCTPITPIPPSVKVECEFSNYRQISIIVAGSSHRANDLPETKAQNNNLNIKPLGPSAKNFNLIPLRAGETMELTFDTENEENNVRLEIRLAAKGLVTLT